MLALPTHQKRMPMMAPELPTELVSRPVQFNGLKQKLQDPRGDALAKCADGYRKTPLAKALALDADDFDGVLWVELGERPTNLVEIIFDVVTKR